MLSFTRIPRNEKEGKNITIYNILREKGGVSRSDISALTNINVVSISNYINTFIKNGLILEKQIGESSGGRPPILLDLNRDNAYAIGLHICDSYILGVAVDFGIKTVNKVKRDIDAGHLEQTIIDIIDLLKKDKTNIKGIALVSEDRNIDITDLEKKIQDKFQIDLYIGKASISACYAESILNAGYPATPLLYSYKDIGDCVFLLEDSSFYAWDDKSQDNLAYLRPWSADRSIKNYAREIIKKGIGTEIIHLAGGSIDKITEKEIIEAARKNDNVAIEILEFTGLNLGVRLAYLVNVFKPKKLILGSGLEKAGKYFIEPLKKSIEKLAKDEALKGLKIENSTLGEEAVATGAAALIVREVFMGT